MMMPNIQRLTMNVAAWAVAISIATAPVGLHAEGVEEKAQLCTACHGEKGIPQDKANPVIWGQNEGYLYLQLRDFKSGARKNDIMAPIAASLEKDDMKALAAYFAGLKWPDLGQPRAPKDVSTKAVGINTSVACTGCHLDQWQGYSVTPRLAGQNQAYLDRTMHEFRDRTRANNPGMSDLMQAVQPDDLAPLAEYLAGL
jgi:cytochrome c553